jgi:hypothetical protein
MRLCLPICLDHVGLKLVPASNRWLSHHWRIMLQHIFNKSFKSTKLAIHFLYIWLILTQHPFLLTYNTWMHTKWEQLNDTWSQGSLVSIVTWIRAGQFRVQVQVGANNSLLQNLQPVSGTNLASNVYGTEGLSWGVNQQGCEVNHLLLSAFEVNNEWG